MAKNKHGTRCGIWDVACGKSRTMPKLVYGQGVASG